MSFIVYRLSSIVKSATTKQPTMKSIISAPQPIAVDEAVRVLQRGGNAIDAAVTCAFAQAVVDPQMCGIGGYALLTAQLAGQPEPIGFDAPALAGSKTSPEMWQNRVIGMNPDGWGYFLRDKVNDAGYTSICAPGTVTMLAHMLEKWGTISWAQAIEPAARLAEDGWQVHETLSRQWRTPAGYPEACSQLEYILRNAEARKIYLKPDGSAYLTGETICNPDYARTLRHLAKHGADDFYTGELAAKMSADLEASGAYVIASDFANYKLRPAPPTRGAYRGHEVASSTAPHGGATLIAILNILEHFEIGKLGHNSPEYILLVSQAMKAAFADRNRFMADAAFVDVPLGWMTSRERAAEWAEHIRAGKPITQSNTPTGTPHTTTISVVDGLGNCVALTHSLGSSSGVITPGLGFMYNNSMVNFDPLPGGANSIAPGKGRTTGMSPTIVYKNGKPVMVLSAPGASRIITGVLQVMLNVIDFGMPIAEAVLAPRFDCQIGEIRCQRRIPSFVLDEVRKRHPISHIPQSHGQMGLVHAITIDPHTGALAGGADSGGDGMAVLVESDG